MAARVPDLTGLTPAEVESILVAAGEPRYRTNQILEWVHVQRVFDFGAMTNLPNALRDRLPTLLGLEMPIVLEKAESRDGTTKFLLDLYDHRTVEMVLIPGVRRTAEGRQIPKHTLCMSSQTGCARGCAFCATAKIGKFRSLETWELVAQVLLAARILEDRDPPARLTNIVMMGMGEPMDNLDQVSHALSILQNERCMSFSPRRITLSTSGVAPGIDRLTESGLKVKLAVSLNSAIDAKRSEIMPINRQYPLAELKRSLLDYQRRSTFRITLEYVLFGGFNTGPEDAKALRKFAGDLSCKINLIPWNPTPGSNFKPPTAQETDRFAGMLLELSSAVTVRKSMGSEIAAACGQLAGQRP
jgi:23S rRNA (adenine2503-C2)-methyltransferase